MANWCFFLTFRGANYWPGYRKLRRREQRKFSFGNSCAFRWLDTRRVHRRMAGTASTHYPRRAHREPGVDVRSFSPMRQIGARSTFGDLVEFDIRVFAGGLSRHARRSARRPLGSQARIIV